LKHFLGASPFSLESMSLSDLKASYPDIQEIYRRYFQSAKFDTVLRRDRSFEAQKLGLISVRHLLEKHRRLRSEKRDQLVQFLLNGDFDGAQCILQETKRFSNVFTLVTTSINALLPSHSDDGSLKREMKGLASRISDSQFLLEMKGIHDEVLRSTVCDIEVLSRSLLSSLIDTTVDAMARAAAAMQQEIFRRTIQHEIESEEIKQRNEAREEFIRKLNARSAPRKDS
jgi:hypothetical protein